MSCLFSSDGQSIRTSNFSISLSSEYSGLASFWIDWFDFLAVQETLKSLLQHNSSKASILWCSAFFIIQFRHPFMTTGKTIVLTRWTFVGKVMSLLFNMLSRLVGEGNGSPLSTLAWKIPWMEEPGRLQSMGSQRVGHDWVTLLFALLLEGNLWQT